MTSKRNETRYQALIDLHDSYQKGLWKKGKCTECGAPGLKSSNSWFHYYSCSGYSCGIMARKVSNGAYGITPKILLRWLLVGTGLFHVD